jgi:hypothetical protein
MSTTVPPSPKVSRNSAFEIDIVVIVDGKKANTVRMGVF